MMRGRTILRARGTRAVIVVLALILILLICSLLLLSCGKKSVTEESGKDTGSEDTVRESADIDGYLEELDSAMDSVNPEDFREDTLSDTELGL